MAPFAEDEKDCRCGCYQSSSIVAEFRYHGRVSKHVTGEALNCSNPKRRDDDFFHYTSIV